MKNDLTDYEKKVMIALCNVDVKFGINVVLGLEKIENLNCIFKIDNNKWGVLLLGNQNILIFDDVVLACYKIIKHSVIPEIVDYVLNYFNVSIKQERKISSFLEYASVKKRERVKNN